MNYLCDTNVLSETIKPAGDGRVVIWIKRLDVIFLSVINVEEVFYGLAHKNAQKQMTWFEKFIELRCEILPVTERISRRAGILRGEFRRDGIVRAQANLLIAATVADQDLIHATRNEKDFQKCGVMAHNPFND